MDVHSACTPYACRRTRVMDVRVDEPTTVYPNTEGGTGDHPTAVATPRRRTIPTERTTAPDRHRRPQTRSQPHRARPGPDQPPARRTPLNKTAEPLMGTVLIGYGDAGYAHEGYAAQVLDDNSITGTDSDETRPRMIDQVVAACDCGWTGTTRYPTTTGPFDADAEQRALTEWEHTHARPTLRRLHLEECARLDGHLRCLAGYSAKLATDSLEVQSRAARHDLLDRVL